MEERFAPAEAAFVFDALEKGMVFEIFGSSDGSTFAQIDTHFGEHVLMFITITQDGSMVDTTMKPTRAPQASEKLTGAKKTTLSNFIRQINAKKRRLQLGLPPIWPRSDFPKAGYHLELMETRSPQALWLRHQARLREIIKPNQEIPRHDKLELYLCTTKRVEEMIKYVGTWQGVLYIANAILNVVLFVLLLIVELFILSPFIQDIPSATVVTLIVLLSWPIMDIIQYLGFVFIRESILPHLPGPKLESVPVLMDKITLVR